MRRLFTVVLGTTLALGSAMAQQVTPGAAKDESLAKPAATLDETDQNFVKDAAGSNAAEIQLGQLAQMKASADEVKQFAAQMVKDHSAANDQLKGLAQSQHVALPSELDAEHKAAKGRLSNLEGSQFDKQYMLTMVQEHEKDVQKFQQEAESANNQTVKQFAATTLPTLQQHLDRARELQSKIESGAIK